MGTLFTDILGWLFNKLLIFIFVLALILVFYSIRQEYVVIQDIEGQIEVLKNRIEFNQKRLADLENTPDEGTKRKIDYIDAQIQKTQNELEQKYVLLKSFDVGIRYILSRIPGTDLFKDRAICIVKIKALETAIAGMEKIKGDLTREVDAYKDIIKKQIDADKIELGRIVRLIDDNLLSIILKRAREQANTALIILLGIITIPIGIKVFSYYIVAPLVEKRPGIQLLPDTSDAIIASNNNKGNISSVSTAIKLEKDEELSIRSEYIQDLPRHNSKKSTQVFINNHLPFSSISTGLFLLSRISTENSEAIAISSTNNPFMEVGIINIPEGSPLVCHPRSLVGVIHKAGEQIHITKHWRLFSLQAWLTLQLRFLVIHGPCKLIVNGCRGVRIEVATEARMINQSATLGFSPNLNYKNTRCETFISYWMGKQDLFNDLFHGDHGIYVYEEMPDRKTGFAGRGFEGFIDAVLRVFGL
jgi:hypothetical protein